MHNMPGLPVGQFAIRPGPDAWPRPTEFTIDDRRARAATPRMPHGAIDPVVVGTPDRHRAADDRRRATSIRSKRPWSRSPCSMPATPTTSSRRPAELAGTVRTLAARQCATWSRARIARDRRAAWRGLRRHGRASTTTAAIR